MFNKKYNCPVCGTPMIYDEQTELLKSNIEEETITCVEWYYCPKCEDSIPVNHLFKFQQTIIFNSGKHNSSFYA